MKNRRACCETVPAKPPDRCCKCGNKPCEFIVCSDGFSAAHCQLVCEAAVCPPLSTSRQKNFLVDAHIEFELGSNANKTNIVVPDCVSEGIDALLNDSCALKNGSPDK